MDDVGRAAAHRAFAAGFRRSRRGNLWRRVHLRTRGPVTVTVFAIVSGGFGWCIASERGPVEFRSARFASQREAIDALAAELRVGDR